MDTILINQENITQNKGVMVCQHLGARFDPNLSFSFPSSNNFCHRASPPEAVLISYQERFCLTTKCRLCPVFQSDGNGPLPKAIRARPRSRLRVFTFLALFVIGVGAVLLMLIYASTQTFSANHLFGLEPQITFQDTETPQASLTVTSVPITRQAIPVVPTVMPATASSTVTASATMTTTSTASPTQTSSACAPPEDWVAYIVKRGDSLALFRQIYSLRKSILLDSNCNPGLEEVTPGQIFFLPYPPPTPTQYRPPPVVIPTQRPPPQPPDSRP